MAMRALRMRSPAPQVVHFMPMQATASPAMDTTIPTIISARVACRAPGEEKSNVMMAAREFDRPRLTGTGFYTMIAING